MKAAVELVRSGSAAELRAALDRDPGLGRHGRLVVEAARVAREAALGLLLERGADPNASYRGYRPLHALIQERPHAQTRTGAERLRCLDRLLGAGASVDLLGAFPPAGALLVAAFTGEQAVVERLLAGGATPDPFAAAALGRLRDVRRALRREPALVSARAGGGLTALQCCAGSRMGRQRPEVREELVAIAGHLLDAGADPNARVKAWSHEVDTAYFAISAQNVELTTLLFERGADPTAALPTALWNGTDELAELALERGADVDRARAGDRPLLNEMIRWGRVRQALWLLEQGADPDQPGPNGWTALHQAASRGDARMVSALLAAGADRQLGDADGRTALDLARAKRKPALVARLSR